MNQDHIPYLGFQIREPSTVHLRPKFEVVVPLARITTIASPQTTTPIANSTTLRGSSLLGGVGFPHVIRRENGVLLGETKGDAGPRVSSRESVSGALSHRYHFDPHSWCITRENEHSCVDVVCSSLGYFFLHRHCV